MTRDELNKEVLVADITFADMVLNAIENVKTPMLLYDGEKEVVKKALNEYIQKYEDELMREMICLVPAKGTKSITSCFSIDEMLAEIEKFNRLQQEYKEQALAEIITKNDFIVGSEELKCKLTEVLPKGANIVYSPYIASPTTIYEIKKFDLMDCIQK